MLAYREPRSSRVAESAPGRCETRCFRADRAFTSPVMSPSPPALIRVPPSPGRRWYRRTRCAVGRGCGPRRRGRHAFTDLGAVAELLGDVAGLQATIGE